MAVLAEMDLKETDEVEAANEIFHRLTRLNLHSKNQSKIPKNQSTTNFEETDDDDDDDEIEVVNENLHRLNLNSENGTKLPPSSWGSMKKKRSIIGGFPRSIPFSWGSIKKKKRSGSVFRRRSSPITPPPKLQRSLSDSISTRAARPRRLLRVEEIVALLLPFESNTAQMMERSVQMMERLCRGINPLIN